MRKRREVSRTDRLWQLEDRAWQGRWHPENTPQANSWWARWYVRIMRTAQREERADD